MATSVEIEKQFLRLIMFSHKVSLPVVRTFFVSGVLGCPDYKNDICTFLEHHKHQIFHLVGDYKCCKCNNLPSLQKRSSTFRLGNDQFKKLYEIGHSQPGHFLKGSGGRVTQQCLCCVTVWKETNPKTYDISLLITILYNSVQLSENNRLCLDTIRTCRNRLCHLNDLNELSEIELHTLWGNLECSVLRLAAEVPSQPDYKESIELLVDTFKYADYSRETITPIMEAMKSEINNNINGVIQNQISAQEEIRCLTTYVEQLSQNCKKDTQDMLKHVSESARTIVHTHQDAFHQLSAQVAQANFEQVENLKYQKNAIIESSQTVAGTMEHVVDKIDFLVHIINNKSQCTENDEALHKSGPTQKVSTPPEHKCNEDSILAKDTQRCKLRWWIETPEHLENKKDDIIQAMKKSIEIVNIGTSYKIEDIYDGSITIDTLLPMSILQDKKAFHRSIRQFLDTMVSICGIDKTIPLVVKVQINFTDQEQESVQYSIEEKKHTTMINKSVNAVPTMNDISTETCENEAHNKIGTSDSHNWTENASLVRILRFKTKDSYGRRRYFSNSLRHSIFDNKEEEEEGDLYDDFILLMGNIIEIQRFLSDLADLDNISEMELIFLPLRKLRRKHIKSIICILAKSSCEEDLLYPNVKELECWPYDVVTVVRANMSIPNLLKGTKRIYDTDIQWPSHVLDVMNKTLSMVYVLQFSDEKDDKNDRLILLIGNTEEVNRFYSAMVRLEDDFNSEMKLEHVPSGQIEKTTIKTIICIVSKSSKVEEFVLQHKIADSECWPNDVVTVLWDKMTVPKFLGGTKHIRNTGEDDKWISDVMDEIKRTMSRIYVLSFSVDKYYRNESYVIPGGDDHELILIMANTEEVRRFYSLLESEHPVHKKMKLQRLPSRKLRASTIKGIICILSKSSKAEELILQHKIEDFHCWPNDVVTVLRDETTVPKLFEGTIQIKETGEDKKWISDVVDVINRTMSMVYLLRFSFDNWYSSASHFYFNDDCDDFHGGDALILLLGNTEEICRFKSALVKSRQNRYSTTEFIHMPSRQIRKSTIQAIIYFISKYLKTEELIMQYKLGNFERKPNDVVTVMRGQMTVPKLLEETKLINDAGEDDKWVLDVMDEIKKALLMVYVLRFPYTHSWRSYRYKDYGNEPIVLMGTEEDVERFYWQVVIYGWSIYSKMKLEHIPGRQLYRTPVKVIICIISKSSKEEEFDMLQKMVYSNSLTNDVVTVVRDKMTIPKVLKGTKLINDTGEDHKWISDLMDEIERTKSTVILKSHPEEERYNPGFRYDMEIRRKTVMNKGDGFKNVNPILKKRSEIDGNKDDQKTRSLKNI